MKSKGEYRPVPPSVFYKGKRPGKCKSFVKASETQAALEKIKHRAKGARVK